MNGLISACIITYNQEGYIAKAIESALQQKFNGEYKIIISDDFSTDNTYNICKKYSFEYPDVIKLIRPEKNLGMIGNWMYVMNACSSKYIALLEGDDYWTDENKLQKQIDFLEANPKYVGCFHNTEERYENDDNKASFLYCDFPSARNISFTDLSNRNIMPTCSVVFRNNLFNEFPEWYTNLKMGDWPLHLLNVQYGNFWYFPKVMAVHRLHSKSIWMLQDPEKNNNNVIEAYDAMIKGFEHNKVLMEQLIKGKEAFINSISKTKSEPSFKQKVKYFLKKMIDKL
jgi:glycosyltransferase involved in cell wall biosynthesis